MGLFGRRRRSKLFYLVLALFAVAVLVWIVKTAYVSTSTSTAVEMVPFKCSRPAGATVDASKVTPGHLDGVDITASGGVQETLKVTPKLIGSIKERLRVVDPKFGDVDLRESDEGSYTENKKTVYICLRDEHGNEYSMNTLVYVTLHELAHLVNHTNYGHTPEFNTIFNKLLCKAAKVGVYDPSVSHDDWYCGVDIRGITPPVCSMIEDFSMDTLELHSDPDVLATLPDGVEV